jgi:phospholipid/cholesterol/gamma-HCH transport system substrate-binding protein
MPRTRSLAWSELKLGIIGIVTLLLVIAVVIGVGGEGFWEERYPLKTQFGDVLGLKPGAVVRLSGKEVGTVTAVEFAGPRIDVTMELLEEVRPLITTESRAVVGSLSLLGEPIVDVTASSDGAPLPDWGYIRSGGTGGPFGQLQDTASDSLQDLQAILADVRAGRGTLGKFLTDEALYRELEGFVASAGRVTDAINQGKGTIGGLLQDPAAYDALRTSLENLQATTARINRGEGALGRFLQDPAMADSLSGTLTNLDQVTARLNRGEGTAGRLMTDTQLYDRLNSMAARVDQLMARLGEGQGTAGQLLHDRQLYENMNRAVAELQSLLADIRKDPKRYLRVTVSIF